MRFTVSAAVLAFAARVLAQVDGFDALTAPAKDEDVPAGETYSIVWQPGTYTGTVSLSLLGGATASTLQVLSTFASKIDNTVGKYDWTVDSSLGDDATYGIKITLDSDETIFQYSFPFHITGASDDSTTSATASSTAAGYPTSGSVTAAASSSAAATTTAVTSKDAESTTVVAASSTAVVESSTAVQVTSSFPTYTAAANSSSVATGSAGATTLSTATSTKTSTGTSSSSTPSTVTTNGAPRAAAGSIALLAGLAAAIFAL